MTCTQRHPDRPVERLLSSVRLATPRGGAVWFAMHSPRAWPEPPQERR
jgi:hypothetical protein